MNGICKVIGAYYGAIPADDDEREFVAVKVYRDGCRPIYLSGRLPTIEEAEAVAGKRHEEDLAERHLEDRAKSLANKMFERV